MATNRREISLNAPADKVWDAVRDFAHVHTRVAPGFLTDLKMDRGDRVLTFFNGLVARERLVTTDDASQRLVLFCRRGPGLALQRRGAGASRRNRKVPTGLDDRPSAR